MRHGIERVRHDLQDAPARAASGPPGPRQRRRATSISSSTRCSRIGSANGGSRLSISRGRLSGNGWNGAGRLKLSRWLMRRSSRSTSSMMASRCSPAVGDAGWRRTSCAAARRLASGFRSPCATAADISPMEASFSACTSCARVRQLELLRVMRRRRAARSPISSRDVAWIGWSSSPEPTTAIASVSSRDRAGEAAGNEPARRPVPPASASTMMATQRPPLVPPGSPPAARRRRARSTPGPGGRSPGSSASGPAGAGP